MILKKLREKIKGVQENIPLAAHTTYRIGGPARYFCLVKGERELVEIITTAKVLNLPFFILGGGSNLLINDEGFDGLVIKIQIDHLKSADNRILVGAGLSLGQLVKDATALSLSGLEWATGIPGTVGGGIYGNCGAFGHSLSESVMSVKTLNPDKLEIKTHTNKQCDFGYRHSVFKTNSEIILEVELKLLAGEPQKIKELINQIVESRKKIPSYPSAGSVFKNIEVSKIHPSHPLQKEGAVLYKIPEDKIKGGKIPAGYLIEQCGLKDQEFGGAKIASEHANFIVNFSGDAKAIDVLALINLCKKEVKNKFGITLEEEIRLIGF